MDITAFHEYYNKVCLYVSDKNLTKALRILELISNSLQNGAFSDELTQIKDSYNGLLNCFRLGIQDADRARQYDLHLFKVIKLLCKANRIVRSQQANDIYGASVKIYGDTPIDIDYFCEQLQAYKSFFETCDPGKKTSVTKAQEHEALAKDIFHQIWVCPSLNSSQTQDLLRLFEPENVPSQDIELFISALTLSLIEYPDKYKFYLLTTICIHLPEYRVRALVGLYIVICIHEQWLTLSDWYETQWNNLKNSITRFQDYLGAIIWLFYTESQTSTIANELKEEFTTRVFSKISLSSDIEELQKNVFENGNKIMSKFFKKHNEDCDTLYLSFCELKNTSFFKEISNWFLTVTPHHSIIMKTHRWNDAILSANTRVCNNDKWNVLQVFPMDKTAEHFVLDSNMNEDEKIHNQIRLYIQDLYRFFYLSPYKGLGSNPFQCDFSPIRHPMIYNAITTKEGKYDILRTLFEFKAYEDYLLLKDIFQDDENLRLEIMKNTGIALQNLKIYESAIKAYKQLQLVDDSDWVTLHLAQCYRAIEQYEKAIELYSILEVKDPENIKLTEHLAICMMQNQQYDKAMEKWFKIEYYSGNKDKALRNIAICCLHTNQFNKGLNNIQKVQEKQSKDFLVMGHLYWLTNDITLSTQNYRTYFLDKGIENFEKAMKEAMPLLNDNGISEWDVQLMMDLVEQ